MKKSSIIIIITILALLILGFLLFYRTEEGEPLIQLNLDTKDSENSNNGFDNPETSSDSDSTTSFEGGGGGSSGGTTSSSGTEEPQIQLPEDLETKPCGFYTGEYKICAGTCPEGKCVSEGRSCYCKK